MRIHRASCSPRAGRSHAIQRRAQQPRRRMTRQSRRRVVHHRRVRHGEASFDERAVLGDERLREEDGEGVRLGRGAFGSVERLGDGECGGVVGGGVERLAASRGSGLLGCLGSVAGRGVAGVGLEGADALAEGLPAAVGVVHVDVGAREGLGVGGGGEAVAGGGAALALAPGFARSAAAATAGDFGRRVHDHRGRFTCAGDPTEFGVVNASGRGRGSRRGVVVGTVEGVGRERGGARGREPRGILSRGRGIRRCGGAGGGRRRGGGGETARGRDANREGRAANDEGGDRRRGRCVVTSVRGRALASGRAAAGTGPEADAAGDRAARKPESIDRTGREIAGRPIRTGQPRAEPLPRDVRCSPSPAFSNTTQQTRSTGLGASSWLTRARSRRAAVSRASAAIRMSRADPPDGPGPAAPMDADVDPRGSRAGRTTRLCVLCPSERGPPPRAPPRAAQAQGAPRRRGVPPPRRVRGSVPPRSQRHRHHVGAPDVHHVVPRGVLRRAQGAPSKRRDPPSSAASNSSARTAAYAAPQSDAHSSDAREATTSRARTPSDADSTQTHSPSRARAQITQAHTSTRVVQNHERRRTPRSSSSRRRRRRARGRHGTRAGRHGTVGRHHASRSPRARRRARAERIGRPQRRRDGDDDAAAAALEEGVVRPSKMSKIDRTRGVIAAVVAAGERVRREAEHEDDDEESVCEAASVEGW